MLSDEDRFRLASGPWGPFSAMGGLCGWHSASSAPGSPRVRGLGHQAGVIELPPALQERPFLM